LGQSWRECFLRDHPRTKSNGESSQTWKTTGSKSGKYAGLRSLHNNYMTLPVIFVMISNHFPATFGNTFNWAVLAGLTLGSVAVRHYINLHEKGQHAAWIIPFAVIALLALIIVTAPVSTNSKYNKTVSFKEVQPIFKSRCISCHSSSPLMICSKLRLVVSSLIHLNKFRKWLNELW
jgi:uncharacterized membrane protein